MADALADRRHVACYGEPAPSWMAGTVAVLRWRAGVARLLLRRPSWSLARNALLFAVVAWLGIVILELARQSFAAQVGLALSGGIPVALWSASGPYLRQTRRAAAAIVPVETERLVLRPARSRDSLAYAASLDADMMAANGWPEALRRSSIAHVRHSDRLPVGHLTVIADRTTDELVGWISLHDVDWAAGTCELGWSMAPYARGKGYGTEALRAALDSIHRNGMRRVTIGTKEDNEPVRRVLERIGAQQVGTGPHTLPDGSTVPSVWYVCAAPTPSSVSAEGSRLQAAG